ncbi:MAG: CPBP family intramembrane metalloprotease [Chloroflexi bacterium]|nr:CPBP family intramembrane metalloprotease [Chloroflexota bacterium]
MKPLQRFGIFLFFLACGLLVFLVFSYYFPLFERSADIIGRIITGIVFLAASLFARHSERFNKYWMILFAFFTALTAISVDFYFSLSKLIIPALNIVWDSPTGWAIEKLESSLLSIVIVLTITRLTGQRIESLYIRRGSLQVGLIVGFIALAAMIATVIPVAEMFFKGENLTWARILNWAPWILIFVLANASNEELLFRGLFIGKMEPFFGKFAANILTTIPFVLMHSFTSYSLDNFVFLALQLLPLSLAWCWLMQKSNNIWGSILFHAAMDIPIVAGIFSANSF